MFTAIFIAYCFLSICSADFENEANAVCGLRQSCALANASASTYTSCCRPCSCDDFCQERKTCCPDMTSYSRNTQIIEQQCLPAAYSYKPTGFLTSLGSLGVYYYFVRADCPVDTTGTILARKCAENSHGNIDDVRYVSSSDGLVIYKNRFCALCHGEKEVIPWEVGIDYKCIKYYFLDSRNYTVAEVNHVLFTRCWLYFKRPKSLNVRTTYCYQEEYLISKCSLQPNPDPNLKIKCEEDTGNLIMYIHNL